MSAREGLLSRICCTSFAGLLVWGQLLWGQLLWGQLPHALPYGLEQGLPSTQVYDLYKSGNAYLWAATDAGVARFDGARWAAVPMQGARAPACDDISYSRRSGLWCRNFLGQLFWFKNGSFRYVPHSGEEKFVQLFSFSQQQLCLVHSDALLLESSHGTFKSVPFPEKTAKIQQASAGLGDTIWVLSSAHKLYVYSPSRGWRVQLDESEVPMGYNQIAFIQNRCWLFSTTDAQIPVLELQQGSLRSVSKRLTVSGPLIDILAFPKRNAMLLLSEAGATAFRRSDSFWQPNPLLSSLRVSDAIPEGNHGYWLSTVGGGVIYLPHAGIRVYTEDVFGEGNVTSLANGPRGKLALGTNGGKILEWDPKNGGVRQSPFRCAKPIQNIGYWPRHQQYTACGCFFDSSTLQKLGGEAQSTKAMFKSSHWLLLGTHMGLYARALIPGVEKSALLGAASTWKVHGPVGRYRLGESRLRSFLATGNSWYVGLEEGLFWLQKGRTDTLTLDPQTQQPLIASALIADVEGRVYVGTYQGQVHVFAGTKRVKTLTAVPEGAAVLGLAWVGNELWVASPIGLWRLLPDGTSQGPLQETSGLPSREIHAILAAENGAWVATPAGLAWVPALVWHAPSPVLPAVVRLASRGREVLPQQNRYILQPDERDIRVGIRPESLVPHGQFQLQYRFGNRATNWRTLTTPSLALYELPPGEHPLALRARHYSVPGPVRTVWLVARPIWWEHRWVQALLGVSALGLAFGVGVALVRRRNRLERLRAEAQLQRLKALRAQMNPHFIFNSLNSLYAAILTHDKTRATRLLNQFSSLMRHVLQYSEQEYVPWAAERKGLELYLALQQARYKDRLHVAWTEDANVPAGLAIPAFMIQPFVENAIEHGLDARPTGGCLRIRVRYTETRQLHVEIVDDGIGRAAAHALQLQRAQKGNSFATQANRQRIALYNEAHRQAIDFQITDLFHPDGQPAGTRVELTLPAPEAA